MDSSQPSILRKDLGSYGMVMVGGVLNIVFAIVYVFTYTPSPYSLSPEIIAPLFIITGLIFIVSGVMGYRGASAKITGVIAIAFSLAEIVFLYIYGVMFMSGLLSLGYLFAIIGGAKLLLSKAS